MIIFDPLIKEYKCYSENVRPTLQRRDLYQQENKALTDNLMDYRTNKISWEEFRANRNKIMAITRKIDDGLKR